MKLVVGLGNPGKKYEGTRHNVGFDCIDRCAEMMDISIDETKFNGIYGKGIVDGEKLILLKPLTYMNLSGECVRAIVDYYRIDIENLLIIYDDLDLPTGKIRLRQKGSAGGHNGIKSIIEHLGTEHFKRIRVGIDRPSQGEAVVDYVLGTFRPEERERIAPAIEKTAKAVQRWMTLPFQQVMNEFN